VIRFFALLKARPYFQNVTGQANTPRAQRCRVEKAPSISGRLHQAIGSNLSVTGIVPGILSLQYGVPGPLLEAGSPSGTKSWAGSVSVPITLLKLSSARSESILIVFEVTIFGYRRGKICRERAISLMGRLISIYTIYGLLSTTSGLGVCYTGPADRTVGITVRVIWNPPGSWDDPYVSRANGN
jgi:hypothetical protein